MAATAEEVGRMSREEVAIRTLTNAAERMRRLEAESERAFPDFAKAQEEMRAVGLPVEIELKPGIAAAFSAWKQEQARAAGRTDAETAWPMRPESIRA